MEAQTYGEDLYIFEETLDLYPSFENFTYYVTLNNEYFAYGTIQSIYTNQDSQIIRMNSGVELICFINPIIGDCNVTSYDEESQSTLSYYATEYKQIYTIRVEGHYEMIIYYNIDTNMYTRTNNFFDYDGTTVSQEWNLADAIASQNTNLTTN